MLLLRSLQRLLVFGYLFITVLAFIVTMTHRIPLKFLWPITHWSYGMMAPYQGDNGINIDVAAEGLLPSGAWQPVDIAAYIPVGLGERNVRLSLRDFYEPGPAYYRSKFTFFALQLLAHERERGRPYVRLRLFQDTWPRSPDGFETNRHPPLLQREFLTDVQ